MMEKAPFIFSNEWKYRLGRHLAFWGFWWLFQSFIYSYTPLLMKFDVFSRFYISSIDSTCYLLQHIILSYWIMYGIIPIFLLKGRYWTAAILTFISIVSTGIMSSIIGRYMIPPLHAFLNVGYVDEKLTSLQINFLSILAGLRGGLTVAGIAATIKISKYWFIKEQRNLQLQKENIESQLTILKAQVHPHFLFNTLNNLYSLTLTQSKTAPLVVTHLSELLRYMLYECNDKEVPLDKEIEALKKYVELEKLRYGNRIDVSFVCNGNTNKLFIAPLLLLPFVENSFKHGVSEQLDQCWINLHIYTEGTTLFFNLSNSFAGEKEAGKTGGLGLQNIKQRLALIYPGQYDLSINQEEEIFNIRLVLSLKSVADAEKITVIRNELKPKPVSVL